MSMRSIYTRAQGDDRLACSGLLQLGTGGGACWTSLKEQRDEVVANPGVVDLDFFPGLYTACVTYSSVAPANTKI